MGAKVRLGHSKTMIEGGKNKARARLLRDLQALVVALMVATLGGCGDEVQPVDAAQDAPVPNVFIVDFETSAGDFAVEVHPEWSPRGAARFRQLVGDGYYDDQRVFRVLPGFVAQWGISGTPSANETTTIADEPVRVSNVRGMLAYAKTSEPNSRTAQVFVNYADNVFLDGMGFSPFARVIEGMEVLDGFVSEYEDTPVQSRIVAEGNAYLDENFPNLTRILRATTR